MSWHSTASHTGRCTRKMPRGRHRVWEMGSLVERKQLAAPRAPAVENTWWSNIYIALGPRVGVGSNKGLPSKHDEKYPGVYP